MPVKYPLPSSVDQAKPIGELTDGEIARIAAVYDSAKRAKSASKGWEDKTPEQRAEHARMMVRARVAGQTPQRRRAIARKAARARWAKVAK